MAASDDLNATKTRIGHPVPSEEVARTLLYWMDVEALTPPEAEEDRDTDPRGTFEARHVPDRDFPWRDRAFGHPDKRYKHYVRFGIFGRETIISLSPTGELYHPKKGGVVRPHPLDGPAMDDPFDRRRKLAEWLTAKANPFFARNMVNRFWGYYTGPEIDQLARGDPNATAVLNVGAVEQHGPHLPTITDTLNGMQALGAALSRLPDDAVVLALPPTNLGKSEEHRDFPGTLSLRGETLRMLLLDIATSVARSGFTKLVLYGTLVNPRLHNGGEGVTDPTGKDDERGVARVGDELEDAARQVPPDQQAAGPQPAVPAVVFAGIEIGQLAFVGTLLAGGSGQSLNNFLGFEVGALSQAPFAALTPSGGGRDPETGKTVVTMDVILTIFGDTLAGERVSGSTRLTLDFCYSCGGCA